MLQDTQSLFPDFGRALASLVLPAGGAVEIAGPILTQLAFKFAGESAARAGGEKADSMGELPFKLSQPLTLGIELEPADRQQPRLQPHARASDLSAPWRTASTRAISSGDHRKHDRDELVGA